VQPACATPAPGGEGRTATAAVLDLAGEHARRELRGRRARVRGRRRRRGRRLGAQARQQPRRRGARAARRERARPPPPGEARSTPPGRGRAPPPAAPLFPPTLPLPLLPGPEEPQARIESLCASV